MNKGVQKARQDPEGVAAKILAAARQVFGQYGFHGATTRTIAQTASLDVSTLYYHFGEKGELYQAVIIDISQDLKARLAQVESVIHGKPLAERLAIAIDLMTDYLFDDPAIANLLLQRYFAKTRHEMTWDQEVPVFASNIARSMGLARDGEVANDAKLQVLAVMMAIYNFVSGEDFFRGLLGLDQEAYRAKVKQTLQFLLIPAFAAREGQASAQG